MAQLPTYGDSASNLMSKIALNTGPNQPSVGDSQLNLLYKICQNTYDTSISSGNPVYASEIVDFADAVNDSITELDAGAF